MALLKNLHLTLCKMSDKQLADVAEYIALVQRARQTRRDAGGPPVLEPERSPEATGNLAESRVRARLKAKRQKHPLAL